MGGRSRVYSFRDGQRRSQIKRAVMSESTKEAQYNVLLELRRRHGLARFGLMSNQTWGEDPKRLAFLLARYKFVAKMLAGKGKVLEVGCADAFGTRVVQQEVTSITAVDFDPLFIAEAQERIDARWPLDLRVHDMLAGPVPPADFAAAYSLDVLEHIESRDEDRFLRNLVNSLAPHATAIIGMPSLESQAYASPASKEGHVNCKTAPELQSLLKKYFHHVFIFSMNDEVVHTGFHKMAHYLLALCCEQRDDPS
jgi:2-polyprenyl-3-methyl-5-hydroxy-6-metoxy-1,4-benzoquinol methylase